MTSLPYCYRAHGFTIQSEIEMPELMQGAGQPDVTVRFGDVPASLDGSIFRGQDYQVSGDRYLLDVRGIGRYLLTAARDVVVAPDPGADAVDVRMLVMSSVMGAIAHQRSLLPLHASAVAVDGQALLFAGEPMAGKSTLAAAFHDRGYPVVADDVAVIALDASGVPVMEAGQRRVKLLPDSLERVGHSLGGREWTRAGAAKYSVGVPGAAPGGPLPIGCIFVLDRRDGDAVAIRRLAGRAKVTALVRETYRRGIPVALGRRGAHFEHCVRMSRLLDVASVERPRGLARIDAVIERLIAEASKHSGHPS